LLGARQTALIVLFSLIELLTPEEIQAVIAQELGTCVTTGLPDAGNLIAVSSGQPPNFAGFIAQALHPTTLEWVRQRCDEDRAAITQDPKAVMSC